LRRKIQRASVAVPNKLIAGVPVLNYEAAYDGEPSLAEGEREGEWVLMAQSGTSDAQLHQLCQAAPHGCRFEGHGTGVPFIELRGTERDLATIVKSAKQDTIKYIEPDAMVQLIPEIETEAQWLLSSNGGKPWGLERIGAHERSHSGSGTSVYVFDTGIRTSHQDFGGRASPAFDLSRGSVNECKGDLSCAQDKQGHGTHCAGTVAGVIWCRTRGYTSELQGFG